MGMPGCPKGSIRSQSFFSPIDWDKIETREIEPPFKPKIVSNLHYTIYTKSRTELVASLTLFVFVKINDLFGSFAYVPYIQIKRNEQFYKLAAN